MNQAETAVLTFLAGESEEQYWPFAPIMRETSLDRATVRKACRSLARKGYTAYMKALWNDFGPAGAGYAATAAGRKVIADMGIAVTSRSQRRTASKTLEELVGQ